MLRSHISVLAFSACLIMTLFVSSSSAFTVTNSATFAARLGTALPKCQTLRSKSEQFGLQRVSWRRPLPNLLELKAIGSALPEQQLLLPVMFSLIAGLSTGLGGLSVFLLRDASPERESAVSAMMLGSAAAAMATVSILDLFLEISHQIGFVETVTCSVLGAATVQLLSSLDPMGILTTPSDDDSSGSRLGRVGVLTAITLTAHNLPEGMAVAVSTMDSARLGLKLTAAIALHNIPEGLAIACPLVASRRFTPLQSAGVAVASGLSEPVGALLTTIVFKNFVTPGGVNYALAFVGGVMMAVALGELLPEAQRLERPGMTAAGAVCGSVVMATSLYFLQ